MIKFLPFALVVIGLFLGAGVIAQEAPNAESTERGTAIISRAADYLAGQDALGVTADILYRFAVGQDRQEMTSVYTLAFKRPKTVAIGMDSPDIEMRVHSDGAQLVVYIPSFSQYTVEATTDAPSVVVKRSGQSPITPVVDMLGEFLEPKPYAHLLEHMTAVSYVGEETIGDVSCDRVSFRHEDLDWDMWVQQGDKPLVTRLSPDLSDMVEDAKAEGMEAEFIISMDLSKWTVGNVDQEVLTFSPAADVRKVDFFSPPQPADLLVGKVAPELKLDLLDGGQLDTTASKGKDIVILDFWATWCGPCRMAMPVLDKVADSFKDDNVRLYAVNLRESPATIKGYLGETGLDLTVAMDVDGKASDLYKVDGIPQTVLIDKAGDVRFVHVGVPPVGEFERSLREQITTMIGDGKKAE